MLALAVLGAESAAVFVSSKQTFVFEICKFGLHTAWKSRLLLKVHTHTVMIILQSTASPFFNQALNTVHSVPSRCTQVFLITIFIALGKHFTVTFPKS